MLREAARLPGRVVFLDSNFADDLEAVRPLLLGLRALRKRFYAGVTLRLAHDEDALKLAADCGLARALIGFESVSERATRGAGKGFNQPARYVEAVRRLHDHGIRVLGCFAFGLDGDDASVFERTVALANGPASTSSATPSPLRCRGPACSPTWRRRSSPTATGSGTTPSTWSSAPPA